MCLVHIHQKFNPSVLYVTNLLHSNSQADNVEDEPGGDVNAAKLGVIKKVYKSFLMHSLENFLNSHFFWRFEKTLNHLRVVGRDHNRGAQEKD